MTPVFPAFNGLVPDALVAAQPQVRNPSIPGLLPSPAFLPHVCAAASTMALGTDMSTSGCAWMDRIVVPGGGQCAAHFFAIRTPSFRAIAVRLHTHCAPPRFLVFGKRGACTKIACDCRQGIGGWAPGQRCRQGRPAPTASTPPTRCSPISALLSSRWPTHRLATLSQFASGWLPHRLLPCFNISRVECSFRWLLVRMQRDQHYTWI